MDRLLTEMGIITRWQMKGRKKMGQSRDGREREKENRMRQATLSLIQKNMGTF